MATSLKVLLRTAAGLDAGLSALLGSAGAIRWYDEQLVQGSALPAVTVQAISNSPTYSLNSRLPTGWSRQQFTIFGRDGEEARSVAAALATFLDSFSAGIGIPNLQQYPNNIVNSREFGIAQTQPLTYQIFVDAMIFSNDEL